VATVAAGTVHTRSGEHEGEVMSPVVRMGIAFVGAYILGCMKKFKLAIAWLGLTRVRE